MQKICKWCGKTFFTEYVSKIYCSEYCRREARDNREVSDYEFVPEGTEPLFEFECAECGRLVKVWSRYDQRIKYCSGRCCKRAKNKRVAEQYAKKRGSNQGMSGGMSLGSLIRREARALRS